MAITAVVCLVALYFLLPTLVPQIPSPLDKYFPKDKIHLGLDLQGGMHLILEVDADKALESMMERTANDLKESLMENKVRFRNVERGKDATMSLELTEASGKTALEKILNEQYSDLEIASTTSREGRQIVYFRFLRGIFYHGGSWNERGAEHQIFGRADAGKGKFHARAAQF